MRFKSAGRRYGASRQCEMMMSHDYSRIVPAFCSKQLMIEPSVVSACSGSLFTYFHPKWNPSVSTSPASPSTSLFFFFYSIYRSWRFAEADCGPAHCARLLCESPPCPVFSSCRSIRVLMRLHFSVSRVYSPVLPGCLHLAPLRLAQARALLKTLNTLITSQSTVRMLLKKKSYPHVCIFLFLPCHGCWEVYWTVIQTGKETFFSPEWLKAACASSLTSLHTRSSSWLLSE